MKNKKLYKVFLSIQSCQSIPKKYNFYDKNKWKLSSCSARNPIMRDQLITKSKQFKMTNKSVPHFRNELTDFVWSVFGFL